MSKLSFRSTPFFVFILVISGFLSFGMKFQEKGTSESDQNDFKRYPRKSGMIVYQRTGVNPGEETLFFDDWGMKESTLTKNKEGKFLEIMNGDFVYQIDLSEKKGKKTFNPIQKMLTDPAVRNSITPIECQRLELLEGEIVGSESIKGNVCDIWDVPKIHLKIWMWQGMALKMESSYPGGEYLKVVKKLKLDSKVSPKKFAIPKSVSIREL